MSHLTGSLTASQEGVHPGTGTGRGNFKLNTVTVYKIEALIEKKKKKNLGWCSFASRRCFLAGLTFKIKGEKKKTTHTFFFFFKAHLSDAFSSLRI